jgi:hypothetical protein
MFLKIFGGMKRIIYLCNEYVPDTNMKHAGRLMKYVAVVALIVLLACQGSLYAADVSRPRTKATSADSIRRQAPILEAPRLQNRMMNSSEPVEIHQQGRRLKIESKSTQMLPIYREGGTFYQAMLLTKGTNWLNGLPRGTYIINGKRYVIY